LPIHGGEKILNAFAGVSIYIGATLRFSPEDEEGNSRETKEDEN